MRYLRTDTFKMLLLLPFVLLQMQFGIALLHHHHNDSWYDHKDPVHHLSTDNPILTKQTLKPGRSVPALSDHLPAANRAAVATPGNITVRRGCPESYGTATYRPTASSLKRAPPA